MRPTVAENAAEKPVSITHFVGNLLNFQRKQIET